MLAGFVCAVGLLIGVGFLNAWNIRRVYGGNAAVIHAHAVHISLDQVLAALLDAETGQRGFIITGEPRYLEPYNDAADRIQSRLEAARQLIADDPEQTQDLTLLTATARSKLDELQETIQLRRDIGFAPAQQRVQTDAGKRAMDEIRTIVTRMESREDRVLAARNAEARRSYGVSLASGIASMSAAIAALIFLFTTVRRNAVQRHESLLTIAAEREYLEVTLMGIGDGVVVTDRTGAVTLMNPIAENLTGRRMDEARHRPIGEVFAIVHEQTRAIVDNPAERALATGMPQALANHTVLVSADGTERAIDDSGAPIRNPGGELVGAVLVFRDVTEQRRSAAALEAALHKAEESRVRLEAQEVELRDALRVKDEFLAVVSHELRSPINAVVGWASMLQAGTLREDRIGSAISSIDRNAKSLAKMIEDLLDMSRLFSGSMRLTASEIDLHALTLEALDGVRLSAENKGVALGIDSETNLPPAFGDADRLKQVVWNLLINSIKFTPTGGRVELTLRAHGAMLRLEVRDTGIGIDRQFLPYVFERFRQAEGSDGRSGLGLGLAIARHLVELHGGTIQAESAGLGHGATFVVVLPAMSAASGAGELALD
jgi:PAS domain S-box-containing protein